MQNIFAFLIDSQVLILLIVGAAIIFVISLNVLTVYLITKRALRKYVKPKLDAEGLIFIDYKWAGFSSNDFKNDRSGDSMWLFVFTKGNPFISIYAYIYFKDSEVKKRVTIKINTAFLFITSVIYSSDI